MVAHRNLANGVLQTFPAGSPNRPSAWGNGQGTYLAQLSAKGGTEHGRDPNGEAFRPA